jgi:hypothetical protein
MSVPQQAGKKKISTHRVFKLGNVGVKFVSYMVRRSFGQFVITLQQTTNNPQKEFSTISTSSADKLAKELGWISRDATLSMPKVNT